GQPPDRPDPMTTQIVTTGDALLALVLAVGFILAGNAISFELGICLAGPLAFIILVVLFALVRGAMLAGVRKTLGVRLVAEANTRPTIPRVQEGIVAEESGTTASRP